MGRIRLISLIGLISLLLAPLYVRAQDFSSTNFTVKDPVIAEPAAYGTSTNYGLWGTIPNIAPTNGTSASFGINPGFLAFSSTTMPILSATAASSTILDLSWTAAVGPSAVTYEPGYATVSGGPYTFGSTQTIRTASVSSLTANTPYYLIVRVKEQSGGVLLGYSNELAITTLTESVADDDDDDDSDATSGSGSASQTVVWTIVTTTLVPLASTTITSSTIILLPGESITVAPPLIRQFGYVVHVKDGVETPIPEAEIQLWRFNEKENVFELWPNEKSAIAITDELGMYSFIVHPGLYQVRADISGFHAYRGPAINVRATGELEQRIELTRKLDVAIPWLWVFVLLILCLALAILTAFLMTRHLARRS